MSAALARGGRITAEEVEVAVDESQPDAPEGLLGGGQGSQEEPCSRRRPPAVLPLLPEPLRLHSRLIRAPFGFLTPANTSRWLFETSLPLFRPLGDLQPASVV